MFMYNIKVIYINFNFRGSCIKWIDELKSKNIKGKYIYR